MATADKAATLTSLAAGADRIQGLVLKILAVSGDVAEDTGARSASAWLGQRMRSG